MNSIYPNSFQHDKMFKEYCDIQNRGKKIPPNQKTGNKTKTVINPVMLILLPPTYISMTKPQLNCKRQTMTIISSKRT